MGWAPCLAPGDYMANADYKPDLSSLENDYQILSELHRSEKSRTFLARHIGLNRDVTITIVHSRDEADRQMLTQLAADTRILTSARHPNIIPVLEGRQLWADTFAVVRARVRGSTLHQLVAEIGPLPLPRAALENINAALEWARKGGILLRQVSPDEVVFQQGSGRVLLAFDPTIPMSDSSLDRCGDARTIGRLAWEMLAGRPVDDPTGKSLTALRPDLPKRIIDETNALMNCRREGPAPNTAAYIAMLGNPPSVLSGRGPMMPGALGVVVPAAAAQARPRAADNAVVVAERGLGFNGRVAVAAAVLAVIVLVALLIVNRDGSDAPVSVSGNPPSDSVSQAAGEVGRQRPADTTKLFAPPTERRHEPGRTIPPALTMPNPGAATDSAAATDLTSAIERGDAPMNRVYSQLIATLRLQSGAAAGDRDPASVAQLREGHRKWLNDRNAACGTVGVGPQYATARAQCYADHSAKRMRELQELLDEIPKL